MNSYQTVILGVCVVSAVNIAHMIVDLRRYNKLVDRYNAATAERNGLLSATALALGCLVQGHPQLAREALERSWKAVTGKGFGEAVDALYEEQKR